MPTPKSVVKYKKMDYGCTVEFTDNVDKTKYYIYELTRAGLRDVGKFVKKEWARRYYNAFKKRTGESIKAIYSKVYSGKNTTAPRVEIGLPHSKKGKEVAGYYSFFQEFGTSRTKRLGLLQNTVEENIDTIRKIEAQYLEKLNGGDVDIETLIDEGDYDE